METSELIYVCSICINVLMYIFMYVVFVFVI